MDNQRKRKSILEKMNQIQGMKKGRLSEEYREKQKDGKTVRLGPYFKHQEWIEGKNVSRRVAVDDAEELREQIDGYHQFQKLSDEFVDVSIEMTQTNAVEIKKRPDDSFQGDDGNRNVCFHRSTAV